MAGPLQKNHAVGGLVIGALQLVCGLLIIILSAVIAGKADAGAILGPWWAGVLFMIPGILGVVAGVTKNRCPMIAFLVLNIIIFIAQAIVTALMGLIVAILGAFKEVTKECVKVGTSTCKCNHKGTTFTMHGIDGDCKVIGDIHSMGLGVLAVLIIAVIITLAGSIMGCVAVCCNNSQPAPTTVIIQQGNAGPGGQQPPAYSQPEPVKY